MKAKTKFLKMYYKLPIEARSALVMRFTNVPMTLSVVHGEILLETELGKQLLKELGFTDLG